MSKYVIIDEEAIQKEIEELKKQYDQKSKVNDNQWCSIISGQILALERILSQSTPLIPEIENAFYEGKNRMQHEIIEKLGLRYQTQQVSQSTILSMRVDSEDYISNLKLV